MTGTSKVSLDLEGQLDELVALLAVGRLEHRHAGDAPEIAVVLFGHAAGHAGVARQADDEAGVHTRIDRADQWVGRHARAGALHRGQRADAAHGRAERHFVGDLFVGRPLGVHVLVGAKAATISVLGVPG